MSFARLTINAAFSQFGVYATYMPASGAPIALRTIVRRPDIDLRYASTTLLADSTTLEVRVADLPEVRTGERITVSGVEYIVQSWACRDPDRLVWTLDARPLAPSEPPPPVVADEEHFVLGQWDGSYEALPEVAVTVGQMVHITPAGHLALSRADAASTAVVSGVVVAAAAAGQPAQWTLNRPVECADWSLLTEEATPALAPGVTYYLSATLSGGVSRTPPALPGQVVVPVGVAVSATVLHASVGPSIHI